MEEDFGPMPSDFTPQTYQTGQPPMANTPRDANMPPSSQSQVPGTSGSPRATPSATPGGVSTGNPAGRFAGGQPSPWGSLAAMFGLGQPTAGAMKPGQGMKIAQLGMRMLGPPASPLRMGSPPPTLSAAGGNPQAAQFQQMFGVDYNTAMQMLNMLHPGSTAMTPQTQSQNIFGGGSFMPPQTPTPPGGQPSMLPSTTMPTPNAPYGVPRQAAASSLPTLPQLGTNMFMPGGLTPPSMSSQLLYGQM